jgi:hypothetical protein
MKCEEVGRWGEMFTSLYPLPPSPTVFYSKGVILKYSGIRT